MPPRGSSIAWGKRLPPSPLRIIDARCCAAARIVDCLGQTTPAVSTSHHRCSLLCRRLDRRLPGANDSRRLHSPGLHPPSPRSVAFFAGLSSRRGFGRLQTRRKGCSPDPCINWILHQAFSIFLNLAGCPSFGVQQSRSAQRSSIAWGKRLPPSPQ
jgi:hypothetical protein